MIHRFLQSMLSYGFFHKFDMINTQIPDDYYNGECVVHQRFLNFLLRGPLMKDIFKSRTTLLIFNPHAVHS